MSYFVTFESRDNNFVSAQNFGFDINFVQQTVY